MHTTRGQKEELMASKVSKSRRDWCPVPGDELTCQLRQPRLFCLPFPQTSPVETRNPRSREVRPSEAMLEEPRGSPRSRLLTLAEAQGTGRHGG